jgi:hypothetical protein
MQFQIREFLIGYHLGGGEENQNRHGRIKTTLNKFRCGEVDGDESLVGRDLEAVLIIFLYFLL